MKKLLLCIFAATLAAHASSGPKDGVLIRLHAPGNPADGEPFVRPVKVGFSQEDFYISKVPIITEKNIERVFPFTNADGSMGCTLALDFSGVQKIDEQTARERDSIIVALVNGRVASAMRVDRRISNGIITIAGGLTEYEIYALLAKYPMIGKESDFPRQKKEARAEMKRLAKSAAEIHKQMKKQLQSNNAR